jgi:hypothetical protein
MSTPLPLETDPIDLLLGPDNDLVIGTDLQFTTGLTAIAQACRIALQMFQDEWFLDLDAGMPYWQDILGQKPDVAIPAAGMAARDALMSVPGVTDVPILNITFDGSTRKMSIPWQVSTAFGDTQPDTIAARTPGAA